MQKYIVKIILYIILLIVMMTLFMSSFASADESITFEGTIENLTKEIRSVAVGFIALAAIAVAIFFMTAAINPGNLTYAKISLAGLIMGVFVLALSDDIGRLMFGVLDKKPEDLKAPTGIKIKSINDPWAGDYSSNSKKNSNNSNKNGIWLPDSNHNNATSEVSNDDPLSTWANTNGF